MGWNASTLAPLTPLLTDEQATSTNSFFLSSIWMSGSGIASDGTNLYFITGNSDPSGTSYNFPNNIEESVVKVTAPNLTVHSVFTPSNYAALDSEDNEIGSGGVAVIPSHTPLIVGGGKDGRMFLLNSASLGGYTPGGPDNVLDMQNVGGCWCAPSFFPGPDGIVRVVSSGGNSVITWKVAIVPPSTTPKFVQEATGQISASTEDPGFFTSCFFKWQRRKPLPDHLGGRTSDNQFKYGHSLRVQRDPGKRNTAIAWSVRSGNVD